MIYRSRIRECIKIHYSVQVMKSSGSSSKVHRLDVLGLLEVVPSEIPRYLELKGL